MTEMLEREWVRELLRMEREACARIAEAQPLFPFTKKGLRQEWVKEQIASKIRERNVKPDYLGEEQPK